MEISIDEKILAETSNCQKNFSCLTGKTNDLCEIVITQFSNSVHFIRCKQDLNCNYRMDFESEKCCLCPTRKEIYNKYKI